MSNQERRILIADDHEVARRGLRTLLASRPHLHIVGEAESGRAALEQARVTRPDIAIIDYALSGLNGLDLTAALRRELPRIQVLVYTIHDQDDLVLAMLRAGARGYVFKSDTERHLLAAVDALSINQPYFTGVISETLLSHFIGAPGGAQSTLTSREREVVQLIAEGRINKEIGELLDISVKTVETHRANAMHKLKLRTTAELVRYAMRNNIIEA